MLRRWLVRLGALVCVALVLVAGLLVGQHNGLICFSEGSGGPPTTTTGPVTISTEHSVYATSDTIPVTITNHLNTPVALLSAASASGTCPLFGLEKLGVGTMTPCYSGEAAPSVSGTTLSANSFTIVDFDSAHLATPLTDGTYQVDTLWVPAPIRGISWSDASRHATGIASQTFRVCTCRSC